jgi:hypothetical protein
VLREAVNLSSTVDHQIGSIMDWSRFDPSLPDKTIYPSFVDENTILRRDFTNSQNILDSAIDYWFAYAANTKEGAPPHKISISVLVLDTLPPTQTVWTDQTKLTTALSIEEAHEMIYAHFQQGKT